MLLLRKFSLFNPQTFTSASDCFLFPFISDRRLLRDMEDYTMSPLNANQSTSEVVFPNAVLAPHFFVKIRIFEGSYNGGSYIFDFEIPANYPFSPPIVTSLSPFPFHPKMNAFNGDLILPILNTDWSPVCTIKMIIFSLQGLFLEPSADPPNLNPVCASILQRNRETFDILVRQNIDVINQCGQAIPLIPSNSTSSLKRSHSSDDESVNDDVDMERSKKVCNSDMRILNTQMTNL